MHIGNVRSVRKLCHACLAPKNMFTLKYVYIKICHALLLHWLCTRKHEQKTHSALRRSLCTQYVYIKIKNKYVYIKNMYI